MVLNTALLPLLRTRREKGVGRGGARGEVGTPLPPSRGRPVYERREKYVIHLLCGCEDGWGGMVLTTPLPPLLLTRGEKGARGEVGEVDARQQAKNECSDAEAGTPRGVYASAILMR